MTIERTGDLVTAAAAAGTGVLAFNVITLEHAEGILDGAARAGRPVVLQVSENAIAYHRGAGAALLRGCAELLDRHEARASLHLDHITDPALHALADGVAVSSVMVDASAEDDATNVARTREASAELHERGLFVEAELGAVGGKGAHVPGVRTDPDDAAAFVAATGVDALAVAVGSTHAMTEQTAALDEDLVSRIAAVVPVPLVLHGSSGVPREQLARVIGLGMAKVNIGTALNVAFTGAVRDVLAAQPDLTDPRRYLGPARDAVADLVAGFLSDLS